MNSATALSPTAVHYPRTWSLPYGVSFDRATWSLATFRQVVAFDTAAILEDGAEGHMLVQGWKDAKSQADGDRADATVSGLTVRSGGQDTGNQWDEGQVERAAPWQWTNVDGGRSFLGALTLGTVAVERPTFRVSTIGAASVQPQWSHTVTDPYGAELARVASKRRASGRKGGRPVTNATGSTLTNAERSWAKRQRAKGVSEQDITAGILAKREAATTAPLTNAERAAGKRAAATRAL